MKDEIIVSLKNVHFKYRSNAKSGEHTPLKGVTFDIYKGETIGILGGNGQGKSTLLKILSEILLPNQGEVKLAKGTRVKLLSLLAGFDPQLTGKENLYFVALLQGHSKREVSENLSNIIEFSGLDDFINKPMKYYSSGMKSRLGFSMVLFLSADLLLIDEILSVGDVGFKKKAEKAMTEKIRNPDQTVVIVSHSESQIKRLCDRVIWIDEGKVKMSGESDVVFEEYNKKFS
jgi:lipopolysaccharide transport system ATP-binding protein